MIHLNKFTYPELILQKLLVNMDYEKNEGLKINIQSSQDGSIGKFGTRLLLQPHQNYN